MRNSFYGCVDHLLLLLSRGLRTLFIFLILCDLLHHQFITASVTTVFTDIHPRTAVPPLCVFYDIDIFIQKHFGRNVFLYTQITLDKIRMHKDTHLRSYFISRDWTVCWNKIHRIAIWASLWSHSPLLCYTANKCGAANTLILYSYPTVWPVFFSHYSMFL